MSWDSTALFRQNSMIILFLWTYYMKVKEIIQGYECEYRLYYRKVEETIQGCECEYGLTTGRLYISVLK